MKIPSFGSASAPGSAQAQMTATVDSTVQIKIELHKKCLLWYLKLSNHLKRFCYYILVYNHNCLIFYSGLELFVNNVHA